MVSVAPANFLQCLVNTGNEEIVPDGRTSVAILGHAVSRESLDQLGKGVRLQDIDELVAPEKQHHHQ